MATRRQVAVIKEKHRSEEELEAILRRISKLQKLKRPELAKKPSAA